MIVTEAIKLVVARLEEPRQYRHEIVSKCPFCGSDKKKFYLNTITGQYDCKRGSCGAKGNLTTLFKHFGIDGVIEYDDAEYVPKYKKPPLKFDMDTVRDLTETDTEIVEYMMSRGITLETLINSGVKFSKKNHNMTFLTYLNGTLKGVLYRTTDKKLFMESGSEQCLWLFDDVDYTNTRLYITEGHIDALTLLEMGIKNVVSMPNGVLSQEWISTHWDNLNKFKEIVLCYDNDEAGNKGLVEARSRLDFATLYRLEYGEYNDINEMYMANCEELYATIRNPKVIDMDGFISLQNVSTSRNILDELSSSGLQQFDRIFGGFGLGQSTIICSSSGSGKTTVVCNMIKGFMSIGEKVGVWSGELNNAMLKTWLYSAIAGEKAIDKVPNPFRAGEFISSVKPEYEERIDKAVDGKLYVYDGNKNNGFKMLEHFERLHKRFGVKYFFVDNLSILDMSVKGIGKYEGEEEFAKALASFTRNNRVHVFLIMHPTKEKMNTDPNFTDKNGRVKKPEYYDQYSVKGSSAIVNLSHNIMFLNKALDHHKAWFIQKISKQLQDKKASPQQIENTVKLIKQEFSLLAYLVKNRSSGYVYEDALFGYSPETRRIYGLTSKHDDLSKEILYDTQPEEVDEYVEIGEDF